MTLLVRGGTLVDTMSDYLIREIEQRGERRRAAADRDRGCPRRPPPRRSVLRDRSAGTSEEVPADAVFILIGAAPHTSWLPPEILRDDHGFILTGVQRPDPTDGLGLATTMPGVFAAGDVRSNPVKRVAAAVGDGSTAIRQVHEARLQRRRAAWSRQGSPDLGRPALSPTGIAFTQPGRLLDARRHGPDPGDGLPKRRVSVVSPICRYLPRMGPAPLLAAADPGNVGTQGLVDITPGVRSRMATSFERLISAPSVSRSGRSR